MMIPGPARSNGRKECTGSHPCIHKVGSSKIHTKTSNVLREKIINYLALAKYTLALFLIRRCKNQATSKFSSPGMQSTHLISGWYKLLVQVESPSDRGVLVQGPKTNRRQGGCALLCSALSLLCYTSSLLCWLNCMLSRASKELWMNHYIPQSQLKVKARLSPSESRGPSYIGAVQATEAEDTYGVATRLEERKTP